MITNLNVKNIRNTLPSSPVARIQTPTHDIRISSKTHSPSGRISRREKLVLPDIKISRGSSSGTSHNVGKAEVKSSGTKCGYVCGFAAQSFSGVARRRNFHRVSILMNFCKPPHFLRENWPRSSFFGVFEGKSGKRCAEFLQKQLFKQITRLEEFPSKIKKALTNGFINTDKLFLLEAEESGDMSGSSALVSFIIGNKCILASCGDSRAILSCDKGTKIKSLFKQHIPQNPSERSRVLESGGSLIADYFINKERQHIATGVLRVVPGHLKVTRAFGNIDAKLQKYGGNSQVVIADPDISHFSISQSSDFLFIATSSLFLYFDYKEIVNSIWETISFNQGREIDAKLDAAVERIVSMAEQKGDVKGLTCLIVAFKSIEENSRQENL
jgi:protein phosphatase 2C family protein 2/3